MKNLVENLSDYDSDNMDVEDSGVRRIVPTNDTGKRLLVKKSDSNIARKRKIHEIDTSSRLEPPLPTKFDRKTMATNIQGLTELGVRFLVSKHVSDTLPNYKTIRSIIIAVAKR